MKKIVILLSAALVLVSCGSMNSERLLQGGAYAAQALTLPESQVQAYVSQYIQQLDAQSPVMGPKDPYTVRLNNLVGKLTQVGDVPLNYKVYKNSEVNAFACADGSVRV